MANIVIRLASEADLPAVKEVSEDVYGGHDYFLGEFLNFLNDPNRRVFIAEMDGKVVGLRAMHIIDEGETVIGHSLRVHYKKRCQGIGTRLVQESRNYVKAKFPQVKFERYATHTVERLSILRKSDDVQFHEAGLFECLVNADVSKLSPRLASYSTEQITDLKLLNKTELERILNQDKLRKISLKGKYIGIREPIHAIASNITNGLFKDGDTMLASYSGESVESLSNSRWCKTLTCPHLMSVCYTLDKQLLKIHLVKQLEQAIQQHSGEMFTFALMIDISLVECTTEFLFKNLSLKKSRDGVKAYDNYYFFEKSMQ
ncbi:histidine N-acetyltransferase-like [Dendronephthya gigantea]|uniref:histidine N-acetyltransferase-like n=1 Tax=Dendronephthya gigantea TaxID=151771 RepID=UPI00106A3508|nr:histidine N-acetyltransferase-like [Dendronephthya gigantea]